MTAVGLVPATLFALNIYSWGLGQTAQVRVHNLINQPAGTTDIWPSRPLKLPVTKSVEDSKHEPEPDDSQLTANVVVPKSPPGGNLIGSEDFFLWIIFATDTRKRWKLKIYPH